MRVNRKEIARCVEERTGCGHRQAVQVIETMFGAMAEALAAGEEIRLHRFGKLFLRPKRTSRNLSPKKPKTATDGKRAMAVAFKGFADLARQINATFEENLEQALSQPLFVEKRAEQRKTPSPDAKAIVRISGIPVCEFQLSSVSGSGTSFLVPDEARILRNIRVGQEIDIRVHQEQSPSGSVLQRCRIVHITRAETEGWEGLVILGVKVLGELPV